VREGDITSGPPHLVRTRVDTNGVAPAKSVFHLEDLVTGQIVIERPAEDVFDFVSDERTEPQYNPEMLSVEKLSGCRSGAARSSAQMKWGRRTVPMLLEFTAFERPSRLGSHSSFSGAAIDGELPFDPLDGGTL
jgi:hypothetical protein